MAERVERVERPPWLAGTAAMGYLVWRSGRNFLAARLARLRQPRYAISAMIGLLYLGFWWSQAFLLRSARPGRMSNGSGTAAATSLWFLALFVAGAALAWVWPGRTAPLRFSETEIHWLFAGPFPRPLLVLYKVAARVPGAFLSALFLSFWRLAAGGGALAWMRALVGFFLLFLTLDLHGKAAGLMRLRARELGVRDGWFSLAAVAMLALLLNGLLPPFASSPGAPRSLDELDARLHGTVGVVVVRPLVWLVRPLAAEDSRSFLAGLPGALVLLLLHVGWIVSIRVNFEESAVDFWMRRLQASAPAEGSRGQPDAVAGRVPGPPPFRLPERAPAEIAFLWKNLIAAGRGLGRGALAAALLVAGLLVLGRPRMVPSLSTGMAEGHALIAKLALGAAAFLLLIGPSLLRNDLRIDLGKLEILKCLPLSGPRIVAGEVAAPLVILAGLEWTLLGVAASAPPGHALPRMLLLPLAIVGPGFLALALVVQNGIAVLFPGWVVLGPEAVRGVGGIGQGIVASLGRTLVLMVALVPASVLGFGLWTAGRAFRWPVPGVLAASAMLAVLVVEAGLGTYLVGCQLAVLEPGEDTRPA